MKHTHYVDAPLQRQKNYTNLFVRAWNKMQHKNDSMPGRIRCINAPHNTIIPRWDPKEHEGYGPCRFNDHQTKTLIRIGAAIA